MIDDKPTSPRRGRPPTGSQTDADRKSRSREAQAKRGLVRIEVVVPVDKAQDVRDFAQRLRTAAEATTKKED